MPDSLIDHLLRRAGFGPAPADAAAWHRLAYEDAVDALLAGLTAEPPADPPGFDPYAPDAIETEWLRRMLRGAAPLAEKLALFWHGHFATSVAKVQDPGAMWAQYRLFRAAGPRRFADLVADVSRDPAMLRWLDGVANVAGHPNENYARELMELFTLGVGHYGETDVREAARALSGWTLHVGRAAFDPAQHATGPKRLLGCAVQGLDDVVAVVCRPPACARRLADRLLRFFVLDPPPADAVERLAAAWRASDGRIDAVLRALLLDPLFRSERARGTHILSPVEFLVGALRSAGATEPPPWAPHALRRMGQALFAPPSVKGWPGGMAWLDTLGMVERFQTAAALGAPHLAAPERMVG